MFNKVLVGVDEHSRGRDAIALASRLVGHGGELVFANVHPGFAFPGRWDNGEFAAIERQGALELLRAVAGESGLGAEIRSIGSDRVGSGLHALAQETGADLMVLGSSHRGRPGQVWLSHTMRQALDGAPCAVAVAPLAYAERDASLARIGIAFSGSEESLAAIETGRALGAELGAATSAFEALPTPAASYSPQDDPSALARDYEESAAARISARTGISASASCGEPIEQLADFSASVDLLIVGSRDFGPVGRLVHGSTTHGLLGHARSPLLILTRAARARETGAKAHAGGVATTA